MDGSALRVVAEDVAMVDTAMAGHRELNAVYVIGGPEPTLIEAAPSADGPIVTGALAKLGIDRGDLAHIVVTHVHLDHAGGAGALLARYPSATVWVHERGAPHLVDPARLVASTARTYGEDRMRSLYGDVTPCDPDRVRAVTDGDAIAIGGGRSLAVLHTPGHASHHVALHDEATGVMFTGEAIGTYLPWATSFRPALPPPEVDLDALADSVDAMRARRPTHLLTSHFGPVPDAQMAFDEALATAGRWSAAVRGALQRDPDADDDALTAEVRRVAADELAAAGLALGDVLDRYDAIGSIRMNAQGLARYWRRRSAEAQDS
ncbi:MAG TPA: MBL fold metallo-hydrolase [Actinomycetota bacterium]|nr:MBL fold metallo-hydrolase [Actinomycetota bacterium]